MGTAIGAAGSAASYAGKPPGHSVPVNPELAASGKDASLSGSVVGFVGDAFTLGNKGGELHDARKDAKAAKGSGSTFWEKATGRQTTIKGADVGIAAGKIATSDIPKITSASMSVAGNVGASTAGIAAGAMALPVSAVSTLRDVRKLGKQVARMRRMEARFKSGSSDSARNAQRLMADIDAEVRVGQERVALGAQAVINASESVRELQDIVWRLAAGGDQRQLPQATKLLSEARDLLPQAQRALDEYELAVADLTAEQKRIHDAYGPMAAAVEDMAGEVEKLNRGEDPSLKTIAYYAKVKNAKGSVRRAVKVISGSLGVVAGIVALVALVSGPAAAVIGPAAVILGAAGAALGLGLAAETGWRFLSKRWARTEGAYVEASPGKGKEGPTGYTRIETLGQRAKATMSFKTKLYDKVGDEYKERKSHRKVMAAALWDYATSDKYDASVRTEAWAVIEDLTGRSAREIVLPSPHDSPGGRFTNKTVRDGEKAAALKLFEDKLKSA